MNIINCLDDSLFEDLPIATVWLPNMTEKNKLFEVDTHISLKVMVLHASLAGSWTRDWNASRHFKYFNIFAEPGQWDSKWDRSPASLFQGMQLC